LSVPDEAKTANIVRSVAADSVAAVGRLEQAAPLVEADRLDAHSARGGELSDRQ